MTRLEKMKIKRESITLQARIKEAQAEMERIRSDYDYLEPETLDVLCSPLQNEINLLREKLIPLLFQRFLWLSKAEQDLVLEVMRKEDERLRGECH